MLTYLHVKNFALINELELSFGPGFSVLTGETGAGKSILIGSMNAISGNKLDKGIIRRGQAYAQVEMQFELDGPYLKTLEEAYGLVADEDSLILSRRYNASGRSVYRINGTTVTGKIMSEVFDHAIDIHSQHEHQSLLNPKAHIDLLDQYLGKTIVNDKIELMDLYTKYRGYMKQLNEDMLDDDQRIREMDFLRFEINEIQSASLVVDEDNRLQHEYRILSNRRKIEEALTKTESLLKSGPDGNVEGLFSAIAESLNGIRTLDEDLNALGHEFDQLESLVYDFGRSLDQYQEGLDGDENSLEEVTERLHIINSLKQKHGETIEEILQVLKAKEEKLEELENYEANMERIKSEVKAFEEDILEYCKKLTVKRKKAALEIAGEIQKVLVDLNFNNNKVEVAVEALEKFTANGMDKVTILISTNKNEPVQPLNKIASGGELSRVMLALKSVFAEMEQLDTLVFDEIDTGISGRTAQKVAEKMAYLSSKRQLICITHLPQIAAMADHHFLIDKEEQKDHVETRITPLADGETHDEIARLIGGASITGATLEAAREMKEQATAIKA